MNKLKILLRNAGQINLVALLLMVLLSSNLVANAATAGDIQSILRTTTFYDPTSGCDQASTDPAPDGAAPASNCACTEANSGSDAGLVGSDNAEKSWNYFKGKGLSDVQAAGIMGNMMQESNFRPEVMQIGGLSKDPYDAKDLGWGIIQWSGNGSSGRSTGDKFFALYNRSGLSGPVYELSTQLDLVWGHMQNKPPITRGDFSIPDFKNITDINSATEYFRLHIEGGTDPGGIRATYAQQILTKYGGQAAGDPGSPPSDSCGAPGSNNSPDCQDAAGVAKILCAAKVYDPVSYEMSGRGGHNGAANWHASCPVIGPSCVLDCSGLVNIAVYDVYGVELGENTDLERAHTTNWQVISFNNLQPGDLVQADPGHVEIVDHIVGNTIHTFGAHTSRYPQPRQVGPSSHTRSSSDLYLHYIGPGS